MRRSKLLVVLLAWACGFGLQGSGYAIDLEGGATLECNEGTIQLLGGDQIPDGVVFWYHGDEKTAFECNDNVFIGTPPSAGDAIYTSSNAGSGPYQRVYPAAIKTIAVGSKELTCGTDGQIGDGTNTYEKLFYEGSDGSKEELLCADGSFGSDYSSVTKVFKAAQTSGEYEQIIPEAMGKIKIGDVELTCGTDGQIGDGTNTYEKLFYEESDGSKEELLCADGSFGSDYLSVTKVFKVAETADDEYEQIIPAAIPTIMIGEDVNQKTLTCGTDGQISDGTSAYEKLFYVEEEVGRKELVCADGSFGGDYSSVTKVFKAAQTSGEYEQIIPEAIPTITIGEDVNQKTLTCGTDGQISDGTSAYEKLFYVEEEVGKKELVCADGSFGSDYLSVTKVFKVAETSGEYEQIIPEAMDKITIGDVELTCGTGGKIDFLYDGIRGETGCDKLFYITNSNSGKTELVCADGSFGEDYLTATKAFKEALEGSGEYQQIAPKALSSITIGDVELTCGTDGVIREDGIEVTEKIYDASKTEIECADGSFAEEYDLSKYTITEEEVEPEPEPEPARSFAPERLLGLVASEGLVERMLTTDHVGAWVDGFTNQGYLKAGTKARLKDDGVSLGYAHRINRSTKVYAFGEMHRWGLHNLVKHQTDYQAGLGIEYKQGAYTYNLLGYRGFGYIKTSGFAGNMVYKHKVNREWSLLPSLTMMNNYVRCEGGSLYGLNMEPGLTLVHHYGAVDFLGGIAGNWRVYHHAEHVARWTTKGNLGIQGRLGKMVRWNVMGNVERGNGFKFGVTGGISIGF